MDHICNPIIQEAGGRIAVYEINLAHTVNSKPIWARVQDTVSKDKNEQQNFSKTIAGVSFLTRFYGYTFPSLF